MVTGDLLDAEDPRAAKWQIDKQRMAKLLSYWMDNAFEIPGLGWRFGLDPIIGLFPIVGDLATTLISLYILSLATQLQIPRITVARMTLNLAIDYVLGSIPLIGNIFDFAWKANDRNMHLLERALAMPELERRTQTIWDWLFMAGILALVIAMFVGSIVLAILVAGWIARAATSTS
jgi:hypothetical protein